MAAPSSTLSDLESSSSSDAEELARCREAAMPAWGLAQRQGGPEKPRADARNNQRPATQPSLSSITISEVVKEPAKAEVQKVPAEDDGFRLFFTSVPGGSEKKAAPQPGRKRLPSGSSSEDSEEEWQRCREAAVSASDILQQSAIHGPIRVDGEAKKKKKKLRKKAKKETSTDLVAATTTTSGTAVGKPEKQSPQLNGDHASLGTKKKRRKKKARKANEASPFPPTKSAVAMPAN
ncbi:protein CUSTOS isoform X5 [Neomonachus schauinslandi]|uniref:Protein CUSTOS n=1 Tax=Neomonachus schauinslandi TaxID=29088 RepID=A0A8M1MWE5_NEOSC|nr:protein CUSTOS isoform X5 [Neomonachus schauinslandi]